MCAKSSDKREKIKLRIADVFKEDVGRGIIRIDPKVMCNLKLKKGDVIEVYNEHKDKRTVGLLGSSNLKDIDSGIIRLESSLRWNLSAHIDDWVTIRKIEIKSAKSITLMSMGKPIDIIDSKKLAKLLEHRLVSEGDIINIYLMGQRYNLKIMRFSPKASAVKFTSKTKIRISDKIDKQKVGLKTWLINDILKAEYTPLKKSPWNDIEFIKSRINRMVDLYSEINAAIIVSEGGALIHSAFSSDLDEIKISAISAAIFQTAKTAVRELKKGKLEQILFRGTKGFLIIMNIDENSILLLSTTHDVKLGLIFEAIQEFLG